jgi:hypothetical protein
MKGKPSKAGKQKSSAPTPEELDALIRERAYQIWEDSGCPHGFDHQHWLQAEREVQSHAVRHDN